MEYSHPEIAKARGRLRAKFKDLEDKRLILRAPELTALYEQLKLQPAGAARAAFGKEVNNLKNELERMVKDSPHAPVKLEPIDVTAPFDINIAPNSRPALLPAENGSIHPLMSELNLILQIFGRMGFYTSESREIDDDYHMFGSLNFPPGHPARDDYDTFMTDEGLIAPAHTSTMQNRVLRQYKSDLEEGKGLRVVIPGRVFRNEDLDARHEHTFYQLEGVYVDENIHAGHLIATLKTFLEAYYEKKLEVKTQPFYFPFTEPSFELTLSCPFCTNNISGDSRLDAAQGSSEERAKRTSSTLSDRQSPTDTAMHQELSGMPGSAGHQGKAAGGGQGCNICSQTGWIELLGCGMIHPNVLAEAGINTSKYTGFAWGGGIDRLVMMKYGIEDVRHFHSGNLNFLRQFK